MSGIIGDNTGDHSGQIATVQGVTTSSGDPAVDTNPDGGIGTVFVNTTSGEMYACTDATAGENVWTNVGDGTGNIEPITYVGSSKGYCLGDGSGTVDNTRIDRYAFASSGDATDVSNLTQGRGTGSSASSTTHGYYCTGRGGATDYNRIDKFEFSSENDATDVGDNTSANYATVGLMSPTHGYSGGGAGDTDMIEKWSFSSGTQNAADVANLSAGAHSCNGNNSLTAGYFTGGTASGRTNIEKIVFATDADTSNVAALSVGRRSGATSSSADHGYLAGGYDGGYSNVIDRFAMASDGDASDVGDIASAAKFGLHHQVSSTTHGYLHGGHIPGTDYNNVIERYAYSSSGNTADVGDLTQALSTTGGCNV